jgi:hypothetical protein
MAGNLSAEGNTKIRRRSYQIVTEKTEWEREALSFVAVWALFGIELISRNTKHVVALDADAMDIALERFGRRRNFFRCSRGRAMGSFRHGSNSTMQGDGRPTSRKSHRASERSGSLWRNGVTS